jgi:hypothetical protein
MLLEVLHVEKLHDSNEWGYATLPRGFHFLFPNIDQRNINADERIRASVVTASICGSRLVEDACELLGLELATSTVLVFQIISFKLSGDAVAFMVPTATSSRSDLNSNGTIQDARGTIGDTTFVTRKTSSELPHHTHNARRRNSVGSALIRHQTIDDAGSLASIDRPPSEDLQASKIYHPFSVSVLALLAPASIFGLLARLGLEALVTYDGQSIFPLAFVQSVGCLIMVTFFTCFYRNRDSRWDRVSDWV